MIPARPGSVLGHAKPVADVFRSARFSQELMAAEPAAAEELRSDEHRLGADGRAFAADRTARLARAVLADLRAIQAYCA